MKSADTGGAEDRTGPPGGAEERSRRSGPGTAGGGSAGGDGLRRQAPGGFAAGGQLLLPAGRPGWSAGALPRIDKAYGLVTWI
ncbi:MAG: hypothetical protein K9L68_12810 [Spirochaetales bacterium]|nr:hypothetical protein [Spirochaetales bacterium]MCF7939473.1 hypothetical protein [Spirochaetales bacterium]